MAAKIARDRLNNGSPIAADGPLGSAGGVAHDINNLLMPVLGLASNLARDEPDPERRKSLLDIQLAAERGRDFVEQVLLLTRRRVATDELTDVSEVVEEAVTLLAPTIPPGVRLDTDIRDRKAGVLGDRTAILRLIQNLLTNALHAVNDKSGEVVIGVHHTHADETVTIEVRDDGVGMPEEIRSRLFDPFFTTRRSGSERGLGLTIVHRVTTELGGDIDVWSEQEKGSAFHIRLPRVEVEGDRSRDRLDSQISPESGSGCVLVVDDDAMVRSTTEALVGSLGYDVVAAEDGRSAFAMLEERRPDRPERPEYAGHGRPGIARGFEPVDSMVPSPITGYGEEAGLRGGIGHRRDPPQAHLSKRSRARDSETSSDPSLHETRSTSPNDSDPRPDAASVDVRCPGRGPPRSSSSSPTTRLDRPDLGARTSRR